MAVRRNSRSIGNYFVGLIIVFILVTNCTMKSGNNKTAELPETTVVIKSTGQAMRLREDTKAPPQVGNFPSADTVSPNLTPIPYTSIAAPTSVSAFYVSKTGNNTDGKSWNTAWNELNQIQWERVNPGNLIIIEGGVYHTSLSVGKNGTSVLPITITTNGEQVILDGKRSVPPYCGESGFTSEKGNDAINLGGRSFIIIDGQEWRGIVIRNHIRGIMMREGASSIIVRNVEIYDNGWSINSGSNTAPDGPGVELGGSDILFEWVIIHDNGQDAFQAGWGVWNFTLRNSWLYNSREHPTEHGKPFNFCSHTDGIQIYDGGLQGPVVVENSIIGPSFSQGIMINNKAVVNNVLIKDTLFVGNANAGIAIQNGGESSNWVLQNITVVQDVTSESWNIKMNGNNHQIRDSVFWGGSWGIGIKNWLEVSGNYSWLTRDQYGVTVVLNPMFIDSDFGRFQGPDFIEFNFQIQNSKIPLRTGSLITSVDQLLTSK